MKRSFRQFLVFATSISLVGCGGMEDAVSTEGGDEPLFGEETSELVSATHSSQSN